MGAPDLGGSTSELAEQPFAESAMGELDGFGSTSRTFWGNVGGRHPLAFESEPDLITSSLLDKTLTIVREWVQAGAPPA